MPNVNITQYYVPYFYIYTCSPVQAEDKIRWVKAVSCKELYADFDEFIPSEFKNDWDPQFYSFTEWYCPDTTSIQIENEIWTINEGTVSSFVINYCD